MTTSHDKNTSVDVQTLTTSTSVQSDQGADFKHMRTSLPWIQHRDLKLCHGLSHYLLPSNLSHSQLCTSSDERSQFHRSRDTISTVSPPSDHVELLRGLSRFKSRLDGDPPHPTVLNSTTFSSGAHNSFPALQIQLGIPIFSSTFFTSPSSLVHSSSRA